MSPPTLLFWLKSNKKIYEIHLILFITDTAAKCMLLQLSGGINSKEMAAITK